MRLEDIGEPGPWSVLRSMIKKKQQQGDIEDVGEPGPWSVLRFTMKKKKQQQQQQQQQRRRDRGPILEREEDGDYAHDSFCLFVFDVIASS
jgi:hypothetical protein